MSEASGAQGSSANDLQFDQAEYAATQAAATCKACTQPMRDVYYEVNGQAFCPSCREHLHNALNRGWPLGRFARATLYGSLAGLVGAAVYYGVRELTGIDFGLISIVVGLMIGAAVKKGSHARGGWLYQGLAMFLTYTAIVLTYLPPVVQAIREKARQEAAGAQPGQQAAQPGGAAKAPAHAGAAQGAAPAANVPPPSLAEFLFALVFMIGLAYALPVMVGFESPMLLIIIGIGLYEAWVINKRAALVIRGPYRIGAAEGGGAVHVQPAG